MAGQANAEAQVRLDHALRALGCRVPEADREGWIRRHTTATIERWVSDAGFSLASMTLSDVLRVVADKLRVEIVRVDSDHELKRVVHQYASRREPSVAVLASELDGGVEAGIVRLKNAQPWEKPLVALVDARGDRAASQVFSACHEVAHAILEPQLEFSFRCREGAIDPLERVVDVIAGEVAFFEPIAKPLLLSATNDKLTLDAVLEFRAGAASTASLGSVCAAAVRFWPRPALWLVARPQAARDGRDRAAPPLRVIKAGQSALARATKLWVPPNFRVPTTSVIHDAFHSASSVSVQANENLAAWRTSKGEVLPSRSVRVSARRFGGTVFALIEAEGPRAVDRRKR